MKRSVLLLVALISWSVPAFAQVEKTIQAPGALELVFQPRKATGTTDWSDISRAGANQHGLVVRVTGGPMAVRVDLECSNDGGVTSTSTIGSMTTVTGGTIALSSATICTDVRINVVTITGGTNVRIYPTYVGVGPAQAAGDISVGDVMVGAQPADDPHYVKCSAAGVAGPCDTNVAKINGVTPLMGAGNTGTGSPRVTIATDQAAVPVSAASLPLPTGAATSAKQDTAQTALDAIKTAIETIDNPPAYDPCDEIAKTTDPISITTDTVIIAATSAKKNYICSLVIVAGAAEIASITEGTGSVCATSEAALMGSTTDANGASFAANGGVSAIGGSATVIAGKTANVDTCLNVSGSNRVSGFVTWVQK